MRSDRPIFYLERGSEHATGFGLFMLKAVLSGRGDEIVDLVNLFR